MSVSLQEIKDILESLSYIIIILGFPTAIIRYFQNIKREQEDRKKEQKGREYGTYDALDKKYLEFLSTCLANPELDIFDIPDKEPSILNPIQKKKEIIAFTMLISVFERAYFMYRDQTGDARRDQWPGWLEYIKGYCRRKNFIEAWNISGLTFDETFQKFMRDLIDNGPPLES